MGEGALFSVAKGITDKASNLLAQEIVLFWNLKDDMEKLNDTVLTISAVIQDAEEKQQHNCNDPRKSASHICAIPQKD